MLEGQCILCFAQEEWSSAWRRRHQLFSRFAKENRVLFVENPTLLPLRWWRNGGFPRAMTGSVQAQEKLPNLFVLPSVTLVPFSRSSLSRAANRFFIFTRVKREMARLGFREPILWAYPNGVVDSFRGYFNEKLLCYDCFDRYSARPLTPAWAAKNVDRQESILARQADLVFAVSEKLKEYLLQFNKHVYLIPNGVDFQHFASGPSGREPAPEVLQLPRPRIGYAGFVSHKLDFRLLTAIADAYPEGSLIFVGREYVRSSEGSDLQLYTALRRRPNVHFLNEKPVAELPSYVHGFDVCLMPFKFPHPQIEHSSPNKLYEYLATGKPIVSVPIPSASEFDSLLYVGQGPDDFLSKLKSALQENDHSLREKRMAAASSNSWDKRIEDISTLISKHLQEKQVQRQKSSA